MTAEFCDTNVLAYAYGLAGGRKWEIARQLVDGLWASRNGALSVQVLQELYVIVTRKAVPPLPPEQARTIVDRLTLWPIIEPSARDVLEAIDNSIRWQISFWDAMLLTAANRAGAAVLWSEDLNPGQVYGRVTVQNPFA
ncbi:MAG TPA: PIN domain-containing protein [Chloroflexota bacterium]|jgi:predicted nucleic acid-binding protein